MTLNYGATLGSNLALGHTTYVALERSQGKLYRIQHPEKLAMLSATVSPSTLHQWNSGTNKI